MPEERARRRLAAILAADVVGFGRLMEADEAGTLAALKLRRREILNPLMARYEGRIFKVTGDGVLAEFASAVNAVRCAVELQRSFAEANRAVGQDRRIRLRIGVNVGDVVVEGSDLYGDGVNVAARLEPLAESDGICLSQSVYDQVKRKLDIRFVEIGPQSLKNIAEPVNVYRVSPLDEDGGPPLLPLPDKPSIAVLPFASMSDDAGQETFVDGLTEDLITDLSRSPGLFVIARNSTFAYKGKAVDVRRIAQDLGVRYLLEGSARRAAGRVRINVQLIDALAGHHLWAERYDRNLEDIFAVQDEVTSRIVEALLGRLVGSPPRNRPKSMEAYDLCVRARVLLEQSPQAAREARLLLQRAIELDPGYAEAHGWLALNHWIAWVHWGEAVAPHRRMSLELAERAVALDTGDAGCRWIQGMILAYEQRWPDADAAFARALDLDPSHADAWAELSDLSVLRGRLAEAMEQAQKAFRLNPFPPSWYHLILGQAQYALRQYEDAVRTLAREETYRTGSRRFLAASLAQLGRIDEARRETELFLVSNPHFTIGHWVAALPFTDPAVRDHFVEGYRKAGLPD
jgi:TolB-like protein/class 3 adenylate cyclase